MKTIFWSKYNPANESNDLLWDLKPEKMYTYAKEKYATEHGDSVNWLKCPAAVDILSSSYYVKNQLDIKISIKDIDLISSDTPHAQKILNFRKFNDDFFIIDYLISLTFFAEENIIASTENPYLDPPSGYFAIPGQYNISKWFRPINPSFMVKVKNKEIEFKKDSPLLGIKFSTQDKINFKEFYFTDTLKEISKEIMGYKLYSKKNSLNTLYSKFSSNKINKVVVKEIKKGLI